MDIIQFGHYSGIEEIDGDSVHRDVLASHGREILDFAMTHLKRNDITGAMDFAPERPITPEVATRYVESFRAVAALPRYKFDFRAATFCSADEIEGITSRLESLLEPVE